MVVSRVPETLRITANGQELKQVEEFKYLGVVYDSTAIKETAVNNRINKYSMNVGLLYQLLKDRHMPHAVKLLIYKSVLKPILTYGCEAWTLTAAIKQQSPRCRNESAEAHQRRHAERDCKVRISELQLKSILQFIEEVHSWVISSTSVTMKSEGSFLSGFVLFEG